VPVIQILDDADVAFRISGAAVLSATTMLADKARRLNGRTSVQRVYVLTILPPVTALTVGLPAQRAIAQRFRALAHRDILGQCSRSVAFGPKQTLSHAHRTGFMWVSSRLLKKGQGMIPAQPSASPDMEAAAN